MSKTRNEGGQIAWQRVFRGEQDFEPLNFKAKSSAAPEMHNNWTDVYYIVDGEVSIVYGGLLNGGKPGPNGEVRGGKWSAICRGQKLVAGDVASTPAGVPHSWEVAPGKSVTYVTVKLAKRERPDLMFETESCQRGISCR